MRSTGRRGLNLYDMECERQPVKDSLDDNAKLGWVA